MSRVGIVLAILVACIGIPNVASARTHKRVHHHAHHKAHHVKSSARATTVKTTARANTVKSSAHHRRSAHANTAKFLPVADTSPPADPSERPDTIEGTYENRGGTPHVTFGPLGGPEPSEAASPAAPPPAAAAPPPAAHPRVTHAHRTRAHHVKLAKKKAAHKAAVEASSSKESSSPAPIAESAPAPRPPDDAAAAYTKMEQQAGEWNGGAEPGKPLKPLGYAGSSPPRLATPAWTRDSDFIPIQDRWRIGFPTWNRYKAGTPGEYPYTLGHWWDPYDQNVLKGDYPIFDQHTFFNMTVMSDTIAEDHRLPTAAPQDTERSNNPDFFGSGNRVDIQQNFILSFDLFHGDAGFKPVDWEFRFTPVFNLNYLDAQETGVTSIDTSKGTTRYDSHVGIQELSFQYKLADLSEYYDVVNAKAGIQPFTSDFRGFIYSDEEPGMRIFGNYDDNKWEYNAAFFEQLDKDTNSGLNTVFRTRGQHVGIANLTRQDFLFPGYDAQLDFAYNNDNGGAHYDNNGFLVRPALVGTIKRHAVNTAYFGFTGDGHIGRINVTNAFYEALGRDSFNPITGQPENINAQMGALELSYERDWLTYKANFFYASGDGNIHSHTASGFDSILDNTDFGAPYSYWNRQGIGLSGTGLLLKGPLSLLPDLRSSKLQGQANFVNPGLLFYNLGLIAKITPRLVGEMDVNFSQFDKVGMLEDLLHQNALGHDLGLDTSIGLRYRPLLIENIILNSGVAFFTPFSGFRDIYEGQELYSFFTSMTFTY